MKKINRPQLLLNAPIDQRLIDEIHPKLYPKYTLVKYHPTEYTIRAAELLKKTVPNLENYSIVECGVWRGGMSVVLAELFPNSPLFLCDSFNGFEPPENSPYSLPKADITDIESNGKERHFPGKFFDSDEGGVSSAVTEEQVRENLKQFGLIPEQHGISLVKGFIRDTLPNMLDTIKEIAFLRIDVDAFAATYECLKILYDHVIPNGIIVFDDYQAVEEATMAIDKFQKENNIKFNFLPTPETGCYIQKDA